MSTLLELESSMIDAPNLNQVYKHNITIGLHDWVNDLGFIPSQCIHGSYKTLRPLSSGRMMLGMCVMLTISSKVLIRSRQLLLLL